MREVPSHWMNRKWRTQVIALRKKRENNNNGRGTSVKDAGTNLHVATCRGSVRCTTKRERDPRLTIEDPKKSGYP